MKFSRGIDIADLLLWHPVRIPNGAWFKDMHDFLKAYDSNGKYTIMLKEGTWWFEKEKDAVFFKLKFG